MIHHRAARLFAAFAGVAAAILLCAPSETKTEVDHQPTEATTPKPPPEEIVESAVIDVQYRDVSDCVANVDVLGADSFDRIQTHVDTPAGCGSSTA